MRDSLSSSRIDKVDTHEVHRTYETWPDLARRGFRSRAEVKESSYRRAYLLGMGGSAAAGDILSGWTAGRGGPELTVFKGYVSATDMRDGLAIACSASGNTAETLRMMKTALEKGATVVSISSGGELAELSEKSGIPHIMMPKVLAPRYLLPFMLFATLAVLDKGMDLSCEKEADEAISAMQSERKKVGTAAVLSVNPAKQLALELLKDTPFVYGGKVTRGVGIRFKNALNENAKKHGHFDGIPDTFHNEIEAWETPGSGFRPIFLRHSLDQSDDIKRQEKMFQMLSKSRRKPIVVRGDGTSSLAQLSTMVYRLDMVSYFVAIALGIDPFPTKFLDEMKR